MRLTDKIKRLSKVQKIAFSVVFALVIVGVIVAIVLANKKDYTATTMRLLRVEGTVNIESSKGGSKPVIDNIRFESGDALNTGADGLASVGLDDTKVVTLQSDSRVEFMKQNKKLELKLTKGALFFEVMEHLKDDEIYEIKTSNMTVGIRGTSGYVYYDESDKKESLVVTDGVVEVSATNPDTGETRTAKIEAGKSIKVHMFSDRTENTIDFEIKDLSEDEVPEFALKRIVENKELLEKVCEYTGWDKDKLIAVLNDAIASIEETESSESSAEETPTPTPEPDPTETLGETEPSLTPTPTTAPTNTPKPTAKPTAKPTTPPTEPTDETDETDETEETEGSSEQSQSNEPEVPGDYSKYIWGEEYEGHKVYIVDLDNEEFLGWVNGDWVVLDPAEEEEGTTILTYYYDNDGEVYFVEVWDRPSDNPPIFESDRT